MSLPGRRLRKRTTRFALRAEVERPRTGLAPGRRAEARAEFRFLWLTMLLINNLELTSGLARNHLSHA